ncbi:hypothetical protein FHS56_002406 [Thermonema lapsum]|uniref:Uncharacterized protein n=1 Tax=Thermonema lapsum TaxID=28195 RepID=A0A846MU64_9BACT|nr:hypothetical protein [Thermonema lapsum]NIK74872.1 hypothetical protein [Thermonema lapsum]
MACHNEKDTLTSPQWILDAERLAAFYESLLALKKKHLACQYPGKSEQMKAPMVVGDYHRGMDSILFISPDGGGKWQEAGKWQLDKKQLLIGKDSLPIKAISSEKFFAIWNSLPKQKNSRQ